jgi:hypothetical protein
MPLRILSRRRVGSTRRIAVGQEDAPDFAAEAFAGELDALQDLGFVACPKMLLRRGIHLAESTVIPRAAVGHRQNQRFVLRSAGGRRVRHIGSEWRAACDRWCGGSTNGSILTRFWLPASAFLRGQPSGDKCSRRTGPALVSTHRPRSVTSQGASVLAGSRSAGIAPPGRNVPARNRCCARRAAAGWFRRWRCRAPAGFPPPGAGWLRGFRERPVDPGPQQGVAAGQVAGAGDDGHLRRVRADHRRGANGDRAGRRSSAPPGRPLAARRWRAAGSTDVAIEHGMTLAAPAGDQYGIGVEGDVGDAAAGQDGAHRVADAAVTADHHPRSGFVTVRE